MKILSLNPGSSSLKFALHDLRVGEEGKCLFRGALDRLGTPEATLTVEAGGRKAVSKRVGTAKFSHAVRHAIETCGGRLEIEAVGCRVVHGGPDFSGAALVDEAVLDTIKALAPLAPLHNARDVETIAAARASLGGVPVVAIFDTAFHRTLPAIASTYALPKQLLEKHAIQRYGFHGISYRYVSELLNRATGQLAAKLVICHLGNGASACAVLNGISIDTSMGMTPLEGLVMGTRSGDVDPGIVLYLEREEHINMRELDRMLNHDSGLAGLSGIGSDVRELAAAASAGNARAELALDVFAYRIAKYIGAYAVALEGLDALAFCGGIGEHSADVRERVCRRMGFLGIRLGAANALPEFSNGAARVDAGDGCCVWVVKTNEEIQIAKETFAMLG